MFSSRGVSKQIVAIALCALSSTGFAQQLSTPPPNSSPDPQANIQMQDVLDIYHLIAGTPIIDLAPTDARQQFAAEDAAKILARTTGKAEAPQPLFKVTDGKTIPGPGGPLPIRVYTPVDASDLPVILYFHGGGFVVATIDTYDASARALAVSAKALVISVEYRKAPEAPFPAALNDAIAAYRWTLANAAVLGGDATRVAVAGESAGGNLAAEICLKAQEQGYPQPVYELLIYPVVDFSINYPSDQTYAKAVPLSTPALLYFTKQYLPNPADATSYDVSPIRASLRGLPPTTIIGAQIDPLQDQGRDYANKLHEAGVKVDYKVYPGVTHEFFGMGAVLDEAKQAEALAGADLRNAFGR